MDEKEVVKIAGIKDVAREAGVSISTVSYALNDSPRVARKTSQRIKKIAEELNYIPNIAGKTLKKSKTQIIGVYLHDFGGSFYSELLRGISDTLNQNGYEVIACSGEKAHLFLPEGLIDGAIVLDNTFTDERAMEYTQNGYSMVFLDRTIEMNNVCSVLIDNKLGTNQAIHHLKNDELNKYYILTGPTNTFDSDQRVQEAKRILENQGFDYEIIEGDFTKDSGYHFAKNLVQSAIYPLGVFCTNDEMAIGMYDYLMETTIKVGEEIKIVGFDNSEVSHYLAPRLSTVDYSRYKWGQEAACKLIESLEGKKVASEIITTSLVKGDSV